MEHVCLFLATNDKDCTVAVGEDRKPAVSEPSSHLRQRYPLGGTFRGIIQRRDPCIPLAQKLMAREKRDRVAVRAHTEEDQVEHGIAGGVAGGECVDELLLVLVRKVV